MADNSEFMLNELKREIDRLEKMINLRKVRSMATDGMILLYFQSLGMDTTTAINLHRNALRQVSDSLVENGVIGMGQITEILDDLVQEIDPSPTG